MRAIMLTVLALSLLGCGGRGNQPAQFTAPAPASMSQTLSCVSGELQEMGYEISSTDERSGVVQATRRVQQPWWRSLIGFRDVLDQLTVHTREGELSVTATSSDPEAAGPVIGGASASAERDARQLVNACGADD